jgi:UDP-N-acetylglucosamine--N-acetylmuramyl-(pentapeptide) pyrophosphoryl-undecaprenol N-acetylglucosamine transferase
MEKHLVPRSGYPFWRIRIRRFERELGVSTLLTLAFLPLAAIGAWRVLGAFRPDCVLGVGAYASGPVVAEAALRGIPTVAVEMDSHMGLTNRILSRLVDKVCLSFPDPEKAGGKYMYTGRPLRPVLLEATREEGLARFGLQSERQVLLVFGGSQGAHVLNNVALDAFAFRETSFQIVHVTGERDYEWAAETLARPGANPAYQAHAFLDDFQLALAAADAVVARAGGSVAEILARGIPSLLVPYPYAVGDHQTKNAHTLTDAGAALTVANADLDAARLVQGVATLLEPAVNARMREAALGLAVRDAAIRIAEVVELLTRRPG